MEPVHFGVLFVLGIGVFGGIMGAWLFQRLRIPQVVGYIVIGVLIGRSGLGLVTTESVESLRLVNLFALGIIGFLVGGELHGSTFKKYGKQFMAILLGEGLAAFGLVGVATGVVVYFVTGNVGASVASGIVYGALASATDPASTMQVLWEYRARGVLTTALVAIVALDDALAMTLYGFGTAVAEMLVGGEASLAEAARAIGLEVVGSVVLGFLAGLGLTFILRHLYEAEKALALAVGTLLLVIATAATFEMDAILATMTLGVTLANVAPVRSKELFRVTRSFASPIYVIFFVLVGARLTIGSMPAWLWIIVAAYMVCMMVGKAVGTYFAARAVGADAAVRKYGGIGLFAQAGIAVGLAIMASHHFSNIMITESLSMGDMFIYTITVTTLGFQILGPPLVKLAVKLADESGRDVTTEDVIATLSVGDVMTADTLAVGEDEPVSGILRLFSEGDHVVLPVVDASGNAMAIVTLEGLKNLLASQESWQWLVAADVALPLGETLTVETPLKTALEKLRTLGIEQLPVMESAGSARPSGMIDGRKTRVFVEEEVLRRRRETA